MFTKIVIALTFLLQVTQVHSKVEDIIVTTEVLPETQYMQAQLVYILRVYSHKKIEHGQFADFNIDGAEVKKLGKIKNFVDKFEGTHYQVIEQRYAIFPENSGFLNIPSINFIGLIQEFTAGSLEALFNPPKEIKQNFPSKILEIKSKPSNFKDDRWLPAQDFILNQSWQLKSSNFKVDEPISLTLTIQAKGLREAQLPNLSIPHIDGLKVYPQSSKLEQHFQDDWLISKKQQLIHLVPKKPGNYILPTIKIAWWDTVNQKRRYAILPAHLINVATNNQEFVINNNFWFFTSIILAILLIVIILFNNINITKNNNSEPKIIKTTTAIKALKQACKQNDPQQAKQALCNWAAIRWSTMPTYNLVSIADKFDDTEIKAQLLELDRLFYAEEKIAWDGKLFWSVMSKNINKTSKEKKDISILPELYS